jgi:hypothetical protein
MNPEGIVAEFVQEYLKTHGDTTPKTQKPPVKLAGGHVLNSKPSVKGRRAQVPAAKVAHG